MSVLIVIGLILLLLKLPALMKACVNSLTSGRNNLWTEGRRSATTSFVENFASSLNAPRRNGAVEASSSVNQR